MSTLEQWQVTGKQYRQGLSIARGTTIDAYLDEKDVKVLYEGWQENWPEPFDFRNDIKAITAEMILEVPEKDFKRVFGHKVANRILEAARSNAGR